MGDSGERVIPVKVAVRSRPLLQWELDEGCVDCVNFIHQANQVIVNQAKAFTYDYVFDWKTEQEVVYRKAVLPLINGVFKGYNGTVLAYGQTGSGKTYSMGSAHCVSQTSATDSLTGVIPRVINDIYKGIEERPTHEFEVKVSYVEIYKEEVKDLLAVNTKNQALAIRENRDGSIRIAGLTEVHVASVEDTLGYMERGNNSRTTGATAMNATSSRSHAIFTIVLESRCIESPDEFTRSKFHLVDLAGSERVKRTKAVGDRLHEGIKINAGLLALGNVISALGEGQHGQHIPYRVSKLTRLLQDSLGGNSLTVMIACISPADSSAEETINTLRYADRARKIKNKAVVNRDPHTAELISLRKEVQQLRMQLLNSNNSTVEVIKDTPLTREQLRQLEEEKRQLLLEMQKLVDTNTEMCEKALATDLSREKLEAAFLELQKQAENVADNPHDLSLVEEAVTDGGLQLCIQRLRELRKKLLEFQISDDIHAAADVIANLTTAVQADEKNDTLENTVTAETEDDNSVKAEHILRTAKLSNQLQELTKALSMKEELARRMSASDENMTAIRSEYEKRLEKLDKEINDLQNERDGLATALEAAKRNNENQKISEKRRIRLLDLEEQIKQLKKEKKEKEKVAKLKAQSDHKIATLHTEIQSMKSNRVKLMKQIKEENCKFQAWKKNKEREVKQLQEKDRKRQCEIVRLERDFTKQKNVLRRKTEEAAASNRRLKEALMKQRITADKRQQSQIKTLESANSRMKSLMEEDLEIAVSCNEAKKHLKELEEDLAALKDQLEKTECGQSPSKRRRTFNINDLDDSQRQRRELTNEYELKEAQLKDLRNKLTDAKDARTRQQTRLLQITSIAEARSVMKHLFVLTVDSRVSEEAHRKEVADLHQQLRTAQAEIHQQRKRLDELGYEREADVTALEKAHQEQILLLTTQLNQSNNNEAKTSSEKEGLLTAQIKIQAGIIEKLQREKDQHESTIKELKGKVFISPQTSGRPSLFRPIVEETDVKTKKKPVEKKRRISYDDDLDESKDIVDDDCVMSDYDSDYVPTPRFRRTTALRPKSDISQITFCSCSKTQCQSRQCGCKKAGISCSEQCRCSSSGCRNRLSLESNADRASNTSNASSNPESSVNLTFVSAPSDQNDDSSGDKENAPYYKRKPLLNGDVEKGPAPVDEVTVQDTTVYKPRYFDSPMSDRDANTVDKGDYLKALPKQVARKKRKLLEVPEMLH